MSKLKRKDYEAQLQPLQAELVRMARWLQASRRERRSAFASGGCW